MSQPQTRFRRNWRGKMILQVQKTTFPPRGNGVGMEWYDATVYDFQQYGLRITHDVNFRYRSTWRGKLVLQIEVTKNHSIDLNGSGYFEDWTTQNWRDATFADVQHYHLGQYQ